MWQCHMMVRPRPRSQLFINAYHCSTPHSLLSLYHHHHRATSTSLFIVDDHPLSFYVALTLVWPQRLTQTLDPSRHHLGSTKLRFRRSTRSPTNAKTILRLWTTSPFLHHLPPWTHPTMPLHNIIRMYPHPRPFARRTLTLALDVFWSVVGGVWRCVLYLVPGGPEQE